jgi:hypothetical protein
MNNMPKNAGETKSQYMERVRATKPTTGAGAPSRPTPPKPTVTPPRPISPKGGAGTGGGRGTAAAPGYGGGKPRRMMSGGMVKGTKK